MPTQMKALIKLLTFLVLLSYAVVIHAGDNSTASTLFVFKSDGTIHCDKSQGATLDSMAQELTSEDIKVFSMRKGYDGREVIALCGTPTGQINVYEITSAKVSEAVSLGFKQLPKPGEKKINKHVLTKVSAMIQKTDVFGPSYLRRYASRI